MLCHSVSSPKYSLCFTINCFLFSCLNHDCFLTKRALEASAMFRSVRFQIGGDAFSVRRIFGFSLNMFQIRATCDAYGPHGGGGCGGGGERSVSS